MKRTLTAAAAALLLFGASAYAQQQQDFSKVEVKTTDLGNKTYMLADGSLAPSKIYRLASLRIGGMVMQNITVRISPAKSSLLLGQSFLSRLKSWSMDNSRQVMIIN